MTSPENGHPVPETVFVSYSRRDSTLATSVVKLLRSRGEVFFDLDSIAGGRRWKEAVMRAIDAATHFYVLWCVHSAQSEEVGDECARAVGGAKRVVPVLLDSTPLAEALGDYQWVDFRPVIGPAHDRHGASRSSRVASPLILAVLLLMLLFIAVFFITLPLGDPSLDPGPAPSSFLPLLAGGAVLAFLLLAARSGIRRRRLRRRAQSLATAIASDLDSHKAR